MISLHRPRYQWLSRFFLNHVLTLVVAFFALTGSSLAGQVRLAWDSVATATGYRAYARTAEAQFSSHLDVGNQTTATISGLTDGKNYCFAVKAYNATATSDYSNERCTIVGTAPAPVASFTASQTTGTAPLTIILTDTSTGTVTSRSWNLGDGTSSTSATTVVKTYSTPGVYNVVLTVTGAGGTSSAATTITIASVVPVANFSASAVTGPAPLQLNFADSSTGTISDWSWNFGDGGTSTAKNPSYIYKNAGSYTVSLTVTGPAGTNQVRKVGYITVTAPPVSASALVAAYGFEEISGSQVLDASGNNNHGTMSGAARSTTSKFGKALAFNGTNSWVTVNDSASLDLTTGMTVSAWVYPTAWATRWSSVILKERTGGVTYSLYANSDVGKPNTTISIGGSDIQLSAGAHLASNVWTHLAATYNGSTEQLYVNGVLVGSRQHSGTLAVSSGPLRIGGNSVWTDEYFQGLIDEVRIYNRALSQAEISADSNRPVVRP